MQHCLTFEVVDQMIQDIRSNNCLFGDLPIIIRGDLAEILLVVCQATKTTIVGACI